MNLRRAFASLLVVMTNGRFIVHISPLGLLFGFHSLSNDGR